ncbi:MAG TPA: tRNA pseudouridine(38-40) synthase TruA [Actinomycetota bacterium]|nr:tRNA pseudouridine(38-40) synthase TruA [Actinomycetota bacterium]
MNLRIDLAYDGAPFRGLAKQPEVRTVQGDVEAALAKIFGRPVETSAAGRTDAGVHALGQVIGVPDAPDDLDLSRLSGSLNSLCGPSIAVARCVPAAEGWHARFSARSRTYVYALLQGVPPDPFLIGTTWHLFEELDVARMNEAAGHLLGEHDFSSFGRVQGTEFSAVRTLFELEAVRRGRIVTITARGNAFIQQMVRSLVGTLVHVGHRKLDPGALPDILAAKDRAAAGPVAPPHGLCLVAVEYDEGWSRPLDVLLHDDGGSHPVDRSASDGRFDPPG